MRIVITGPFDQRVRESLENDGHEVTHLSANVGRQELADRLEWADAYVLGGFEYLTPQVLEGARDLRLVVFLGVQPETFMDPQAKQLLEQRGVALAATGGDASNAVAELALGLALAAKRHLVTVANDVAERKWPAATGTELAGETVGILGMGRIGRRLAVLLSGFGCPILYFDSRRWEEDQQHHAAQVDLDRLLAQSDVISLHTPLTDETRGMIGERELRAMKPTAVLVNTARPWLVDPVALRKALERGYPAAVAFDGYYLEGGELEQAMGDPYRLLEMRDRFICTSHQGFNTVSAIKRASESAAGHLLALGERMGAPVGA